MAWKWRACNTNPSPVLDAPLLNLLFAAIEQPFVCNVFCSHVLLYGLCFNITVDCENRSCCENAWLCASDADSFRPPRETITFKFVCFEALELNSETFSAIVFCFGFFCVSVRSEGWVHCFISQVCSVFISALVRSPYTVWSAYVTVSPQWSIEGSGHAIFFGSFSFKCRFMSVDC